MTSSINSGAQNIYKEKQLGKLCYRADTQKVVISFQNLLNLKIILRLFTELMLIVTKICYFPNITAE